MVFRKITMTYDEIYPIACRVLDTLRPYSDRIEIAGSIRRKCQNCGDIEIVWIPSKHGQWAAYDIIETWRKVKGDAFGKYTQRILPEGVKLDLFRANKNNWGLIYAIRTGSADFSHHVLACGWKHAMYVSHEGNLYKITNDCLGERSDTPTPVPEEEDLFRLIGINYVEPEKRF